MFVWFGVFCRLPTISHCLQLDPSLAVAGVGNYERQMTHHLKHLDLYICLCKSYHNVTTICIYIYIYGIYVHNFEPNFFRPWIRKRTKMKPENEGYQVQSLFWRGPLSGSYGSFGEFLNIWGLQKVGKKCRYSGRLKGEQTELRYSLAKKKQLVHGTAKNW